MGRHRRDDLRGEAEVNDKQASALEEQKFRLVAIWAGRRISLALPTNRATRHRNTLMLARVWASCSPSGRCLEQRVLHPALVESSGKREGGHREETRGCIVRKSNWHEISL